MRIVGHEVPAIVSMVVWIALAGVGLYGVYLYDNHVKRVK